jgi:hypothetical protein
MIKKGSLAFATDFGRMSSDILPALYIRIIFLCLCQMALKEQQ